MFNDDMVCKHFVSALDSGAGEERKNKIVVITFFFSFAFSFFCIHLHGKVGTIILYSAGQQWLHMPMERSFAYFFLSIPLLDIVRYLHFSQRV